MKKKRSDSYYCFSILFAIYTIIGWYPEIKIQAAESREPFKLSGYKRVSVAKSKTCLSDASSVFINTFMRV